MELYPFQDGMMEGLRAVYKSGARRPLLVSPTGSGKTVLFSAFTRNHVAKGGRVMILVHRQELIDQVADTLTQFEVPHGLIAPDAQPQPSCATQIASVFTAVRRELAWWNPTLIIVDEAHHAVASTTWGRVLARYPKARVLGVTATPVRLSGEGLGESFDVLVEGPSTQELIDQGYLARFRTYCPSAPDLSRVRKRMGDFSVSDLVSAVDRPALTGDAVAHYQRHSLNRQAVAFCCSVEHAHHVAEEFRTAGLKAAVLDGTTPRDWRRDIVRDFRQCRLRVLSSCDLISEGFDCPGIEVGISLRPTHSLGLWLQQVGRCLRTAPGKEEAIILDHAGNALRHGLPTEPREWSLQGVKKRDARHTPTVRVCPKCWAAMASTATACVQCGHVFEIKSREVARRTGDLTELSPEEITALRARQAQADDATLKVLTTLGQRRGYKDAASWARYVLAGQKRKRDRKMRA